MPAAKHLHIICLDVPYPVDYGGVFDLFYKIKTLSEMGIKIHLHCFEYGRGQKPELNKYCVEVFYYKRITGLKGISPTAPYMVASRGNKLLLRNLLKDNYPILMEGMHCTYFLHTGQLPASRCYVRLHNVEYQYYRQLAQTSQSFFKKIYYNIESRLLKVYERKMANKTLFWNVTEKDAQVMRDKFGYKTIEYLPLFLPEYETSYPGPTGNYCLYHGNLSVPENEEAAIWLLQNVFAQTQLPFVIAGKNPTERLVSLAKNYGHVTVSANPSSSEMDGLLMNAHINILPSLNSTGIKLKLINALYKGRHCLVNKAGAEGSGLEQCCVIADTPELLQQSLRYLFTVSFNEFMYQRRMVQLTQVFNNEQSAGRIIEKIFE